jgi:hypothetical protein
MGEFTAVDVVPLGLTLLATIGFLILGWQALQALKK